jgi:hypothetical protein
MNNKIIIIIYLQRLIYIERIYNAIAGLEIFYLHDVAKTLAC